MNKKLIVLTMALSAILFSTNSALAVPSTNPVKVGDKVIFSYGDHGGNGGGEFWVNVNGKANVFQTFCLEYSEHIYLGQTYTVQGISTEAKNGGLGNGGAPAGSDPISAYTAYLYHNFYWGTLAGYTYTDYGASGSAKSLQEAIWYFENERSTKNGIGDNFSNQFTSLAKDAVDGGSWKGIGDVRVMNLGNAQDQLTVAPVPEPTTMLLFGTGLIGLAGIARRRQNT